jgi:hypothetical protein
MARHIHASTVALLLLGRAVFSRGTGEECEQPVLISRHFHWFALVDAESAKTRKAEELTTEALRRAPVTATICITYQVSVYLYCRSLAGVQKAEIKTDYEQSSRIRDFSWRRSWLNF